MVGQNYGEGKKWSMGLNTMDFIYMRVGLKTRRKEW